MWEMQDLQSIGGGGGRLFGGGDRRLRPHNQQNQTLKCPRCESLNTKFCYYNNYNLSQPRHFCKSCRRYWTKGGVLRNVPVGGGCRKTKRSKPKPSSDTHKSNSHSSSENSNVTAATTAITATATATATATEVVSGTSSNSAPTLLNIPDSKLFNFPQTANPSFSLPLVNQSAEGGILPEIGPFTTLMTSLNDQSLLGFNISDISNSSYNKCEVSEIQRPSQLKMYGNITAGFLDQTPQLEFTGLDNNGGLPEVDWHAGGDNGLFDLAGTVDNSYWTQAQWTDNDHSLNYLP